MNKLSQWSIGLLIAATLGLLISASAQTTNFDCSSFSRNSNAACGVAPIGGAGANFAYVGSGGNFPSISGSKAYLMTTGNGHAAYAMNYQQPVSTKAFTARWTFVPNGWNLAFVMNNNTNTDAGPTGKSFFAGAGCEAGFYEAFDGNNTPPTNVFALELDSQSSLTENGTFSYSSAQIYHAAQSPCNPNDGQSNYYSTTKISTAPVPLNSPAGCPVAAPAILIRRPCPTTEPL
jgi:hypothetical protein